MFATLCLLGVLQAPPPMDGSLPAARGAPLPRPAPLARSVTAPPSSEEFFLTPSLRAGQELVYRGSFTEQAPGRHVLLNRSYRFETRVFILEVTTQGTETAILTLVKDDTAAGIRPAENVSLKAPAQEARSARLEQVIFDRQGRAVPPARVSLAVPLEGPPALECGFCVPVPAGRIGIGRPWTALEAGRPETTWRVTGPEIVGVSCLRITGEQKSDDWDKPRADRIAWRRQEAVWIVPRTGIAQRVERRIEHRLAGRTEPSHVSILSYELQSSLQFPSSLADNSRRDILQTIQLQQSVRPLLEPGKAGTQLDGFIARAKAYADTHSLTPYREALVQLKQRMEAARRGETPPALPSLMGPEPEETGPRSLTVGRAAPDFIAADFLRPGESISSRNLRGKPVLMVFYNPESRCLDELMPMLHKLGEKHPEMVLIGLVLTGTPDRVGRQKAEKGWKLPVLNGSGLKNTYGVDCTPRMVMIGADGTVQGIVVGWGEETPSEVQAVLPRWLRR